jgi:hypothetical protein
LPADPTFDATPRLCRDLVGTLYDARLGAQSVRNRVFRTLFQRSRKPQTVLAAEGSEQAWICEMGRRSSDGPLRRFADRVAAAPLSFARGSVVYESPSQGRIEFGWRGPLRHRGERVPMRDFPRYDSPYARAPFPLEEIRVQCGGEWLQLDWAKGERLSSRLLGS